MEDEACNLCFTRKLANNEKGAIGSLVKKGLIYDSFADMADMADMGGGYERHNYFPTEAGLEALDTAYDWVAPEWWSAKPTPLGVTVKTAGHE